MKVSEPIGDHNWGAFVVRVAVGAFLLLKGMHDIDKAPLVFAQVGFLKTATPQFLTLLGLLIPYLEVLAGALVLVGFWTTVGAALSAVIALFFVYLTGIFSNLGGIRLLNDDVLLLAGALSLLYSGAGFLSVDRFRKAS